ncbi:MAG: hypothetical protein NTV86_08245, partial [Planctomycetota bacterium]|nr:hypothetical protein [Planctomycetota bacterium]
MTLGTRRGGAVRLAGWAVAFACAVGTSGEALAKSPLRPEGIGKPVPASPPVPVIAPGPPGSTTLVSVDANSQRALANALRYIGQGEFDSAAEVLQSLLSRADAGFVATDERGRYRATAARANEVLGSMGEQGLARYRLLYDAKAAALLQQAGGPGGEKLLLQVAREYLHTRSGPAALEAIGNLRFDQGQFDAAGRYWQQAAAGGDESLRPGRLGKRAVALHLAGQEALAKVQVEELSKRYPDATAAMGGREWKLREFLTWAGRLAPAAAQTRATPSQGEWLGTASGQSLAGMSDCNVVPNPQWQAAEP